MDPAPFQLRYSVIMRHYPFYGELNVSLPNASEQGSQSCELPEEDEVGSLKKNNKKHRSLFTRRAIFGLTKYSFMINFV